MYRQHTQQISHTERPAIGRRHGLAPFMALAMVVGVVGVTSAPISAQAATSTSTMYFCVNTTTSAMTFS